MDKRPIVGDIDRPVKAKIILFRLGIARTAAYQRRPLRGRHSLRQAVKATGYFASSLPANGNASVQYVIATEHNNNASGFGTQCCAWHSSTCDAGLIHQDAHVSLVLSGPRLRTLHHRLGSTGNDISNYRHWSEPRNADSPATPPAGFPDCRRFTGPIRGRVFRTPTECPVNHVGPSSA